MTIEALQKAIEDCAPCAIAVSGGVDSMTLATVAGRYLGSRAQMFHAVSSAVPARATGRVRQFAAEEGWKLTLIDAGEFEDPDYLANPANRCFFCKLDLYGTIAAKTDLQILSGTNLDDLGDYRPGLKAAERHRVRHPFVEAGMSKQQVRETARLLELGDLSELPAAPCLASRIETGIVIDPAMLKAIDRVEELVRRTLAAQVVRCRRRQGGFVIELDAAALAQLGVQEREDLASVIGEEFGDLSAGAVRFEPYRQGSAFLRGAGD